MSTVWDKALLQFGVDMKIRSFHGRPREYESALKALRDAKAEVAAAESSLEDAKSKRFYAAQRVGNLEAKFKCSTLQRISEPK